MNTIRRGFTLIELMVVAAIAVVILVLAAPSFQSMVLSQRLRAVSAQFATDVQFARSEAPSRQRKVYLADTPRTNAPNPAMTCYIVYTCPTPATCLPCDCTAPEGARCSGGAEELRTQQVLESQGVRIGFIATALPGNLPPSFMSFNPVTGELEITFPLMFGLSPPSTGEAWVEAAIPQLSGSPAIRTEIGVSGRPRQCSPRGVVPTVAACPP